VEEDHEERLIKIFKLIDFINDKSLEELEEIYNEMSDILEHNAKIVKTIPFNLNAL
jgi:N-glycosylase/DNA lyase